MEEKLPAGFMRVHKSYIVALSKIHSVEHHRILIGEKRIPVGNQFKEKFYKMIDSSRI
jgi:DNA-binding LytR/AlgR family response regulator